MFEGTVLEKLTFVLDPGPDHTSQLAAMGHLLDGIAPPDYLRAARLVPDNDTNAGCSDSADAFYRLIVTTVETWFADEDQLGGVLRGRAISGMDALNEINGLLVETRSVAHVHTDVTGMVRPRRSIGVGHDDGHVSRQRGCRRPSVL